MVKTWAILPVTVAITTRIGWTVFKYKLLPRYSPVLAGVKLLIAVPLSTVFNQKRRSAFNSFLRSIDSFTDSKYQLRKTKTNTRSSQGQVAFILFVNCSTTSVSWFQRSQPKYTNEPMLIIHLMRGYHVRNGLFPVCTSDCGLRFNGLCYLRVLAWRKIILTTR